MFNKNLQIKFKLKKLNKNHNFKIMKILKIKSNLINNLIRFH